MVTFLKHTLETAYKQKFKRSRPVTKQRYAWTDDSTEELRAAFYCTDWDLLFNSASSLDEATDAITRYVKFCVDTIIPCKTFKMFPNNKPWVTKELRDLLKVKNGALINGNKARVKEVQRKLNA